MSYCRWFRIVSFRFTSPYQESHLGNFLCNFLLRPCSLLWEVWPCMWAQNAHRPFYARRVTVMAAAGPAWPGPCCPGSLHSRNILTTLKPGCILPTHSPLTEQVSCGSLSSRSKRSQATWRGPPALGLPPTRVWGWLRALVPALWPCREPPELGEDWQWGLHWGNLPGLQLSLWFLLFPNPKGWGLSQHQKCELKF